MLEVQRKQIQKKEKNEEIFLQGCRINEEADVLFSMADITDVFKADSKGQPIPERQGRSVPLCCWRDLDPDRETLGRMVEVTVSLGFVQRTRKLWNGTVVRIGKSRE